MMMNPRLSEQYTKVIAAEYTRWKKKEELEIASFRAYMKLTPKYRNAVNVEVDKLARHFPNMGLRSAFQLVSEISRYIYESTRIAE